MRNALTTIPFLFVATVSIAQILYVGGGMNISIINNTSLDYVIKSYNEQRSGILTKQMDDFGFMRGAAVTAGLIGQTGITIEAAWVGRHAKQSAESSDSTRDLKLRNNSFNVGFGYSLRNETVFCPGLLMSFDFGSFKSFTRTGTAQEIDDAGYEQVMKETQMGMTFMLNLMIAGKKKPVGFSVRPYYQFQFLEPDFQELNEALNPNTAPNAAGLDLSESLGNFGVQAALMLTFRRE